MLGLLGSYSVSEPGKELEVLEVKSDVVSVLGTATYPLIRSREENLRLVGEYEYRRVDTDLLDSAFNRDRLHVVRAGASYDRTDRWDGINAIQFTLHKGLDVFDANEDDDPLSSRADGDAEFSKVTLDVTRVQRLPAGLSLLLTATGQYTRDPLLASEEIALGGPSYGRGFETGTVSGDNGWAGSAELRYTPNLPEYVPHGVQFYVFADRGQVWNIDFDQTIDRFDMASAGAGIRANVTDYLFASVELARGLMSPSPDEPEETHGFFNVVAHF